MSRAFVKEAENETAELPDRPISPHRIVVFKPSAILKQRINAAPASEGLQE
jgi:hypothetical protein